MSASNPNDFDEDEGKKAEPGKRFKDFDCPSCNANNPYDEGFSEGAEVRCYYCGLEYKVEVNDSGRVRFREI